MKKRKAVEYKGFTIREVRPGYFMADNCRRSNRKRRCFNSIGEARTYCEHEAVTFTNLGLSAYSLTDKQRIDAKEALELLGGRIPLAVAARFWMRHNPSGDAVTLRTLGEQFLADLTRRGCRATTLTERRQKINRLCADLGDRPSVSITTQEILGWMDEKGLTGATADGYRRMFKAWFNYGLKQGILESNPIDRIERPVTDEKMPEHWPVKTIEALLYAAEEVYPRLIPALAIMAFAGLRPGEVAGLQWAQVDLAEKIIRVTPESSKVRRARLVDISDNLAAWLTKYRQSSGPVAPPPMSYRRWRERVMRKANIETWPADILRHTYATNHFAKNQDAGKLAAQMGHVGGADVLYRHYRGLATAKEAARFWAIVPHEESNVIELRVGA